MGVGRERGTGAPSTQIVSKGARFELKPIGAFPRSLDRDGRSFWVEVSTQKEIRDRSEGLQALVRSPKAWSTNRWSCGRGSATRATAIGCWLLRRRAAWRQQQMRQGAKATTPAVQRQPIGEANSVLFFKRFERSYAYQQVFPCARERHRQGKEEDEPVS